MRLVCLELDNRVDPLLELDNLKDVVNVYSRRTFVVFSTMNSLNEDLNVYFLTDWKNVLLSLLSMKVTFKAIVCICD
jgi:hypothetical protein